MLFSRYYYLVKDDHDRYMCGYHNDGWNQPSASTHIPYICHLSGIIFRPSWKAAILYIWRKFSLQLLYTAISNKVLYSNIIIITIPDTDHVLAVSTIAKKGW